MEESYNTVAQFDSPYSVTVDLNGNLYVADQLNHCIQKITPAGVVSTLAGNGTEGYKDGTGQVAKFNCPLGITVDSSGNFYVADQLNHCIRKITPAGVVSTLAGNGKEGYKDGPGSTARFMSPYSVTVNSDDNVYVADTFNHCIRKITPAGVVSTFAGNGKEGYKDGFGSTAQFNSPIGVAADFDGNVYVADTFNHRIRKITPRGAVSTLAGGKKGYEDGIDTEAQFNLPTDVAVDSDDSIYVADTLNHCVRKVTPAGEVSTLAGIGTEGYRDGPGSEARFNYPTGVAVNFDGNIYVADTNSYRIRKITPAGVVSTLAGSGMWGY